MPNSVVYRRGARAEEQTLVVRVNGKNPNYLLNFDSIAHATLREIDILLLDLLEIAATIACADGTVTRGGITRSNFGEKWHREFEYKIVVRKPEFWSRPDVTMALEDCVSFMSDEVIGFTFVQGRHMATTQDYMDIDPDGVAGMAVDDVVLFSGGLDSFAGALQLLSETDRKVALVTHRSAPKLRKHQEELAGMLKRKFPGRVLFMPIAAHRVGRSSDERTQRTRSFLFAALGYTLARALGAKTIRFYENGIISQNLPISPQVIGTMATRTTHPLTFETLRAFLDLLGPIPIQTPFEWKTKTEILEIIRQYGGAEFIQASVSCTHVLQQEVRRTHCGTCSQCLDRRFAVLATGMAEFDPVRLYRTDVLFGAHEDVRSRTMALEWTRHALGLVDIDGTTFLERFGNEIARVIAGHPDVMEHVVFREMVDLHRRHGAHVKAALAAAVSTHASWLLDPKSPSTSLLKLVVGGQGQDVPDLTMSAAQVSMADPAADDGEDEDDTVFASGRLEASFWTTSDGMDVVAVHHLGRVEGAPAAIAHDLLVYYQEDLAARLPASNYRFTHGGTLGKARGVGKAAVAKNVQRCRDTLAEYYRALHNRAPEQPLLIQSNKPDGYRLDPDCRVIDPHYNRN